MKVFVSGTFDLLHSGHIKFLQEAARFGDVYVGIGSDASIEKYKGKPPVCNEQERKYMLMAIKGVIDVSINPGEGPNDCLMNKILSVCDIFIVNDDQWTIQKESYCIDKNIKLIELLRIPEFGLPERSTTKLRECK